MEKAIDGGLYFAAGRRGAHSSRMLTLGLSNMRDAAAALFEDGRVVAAEEEERFVRIEHVAALPVQAIRYCMEEAGVRLSDIDAVAVPWRYCEIVRRAALAIGAMLQSPQWFRVKSARSVENLLTRRRDAEM